MLLFARDAVAANLAMLELLQVQPLDELGRRQSSRDVVLVPQNQKRNPRNSGLGQKVMKLALGNLDVLVVRGIHDVNDAVHSPAVPLPHAPEAGLPAKVPKLDCHGSLRYFPRVESNLAPVFWGAGEERENSRQPRSGE